MITVFRNATFERSWILQSVDGTPIDVTDAACEFVVLDSYDEGNVIFSCDVNDYIAVTADEGLFECSVPGESFDLPAGDYVCFCRAILDPQTSPRTVMLESSHMHVQHIPEA